MELREGCAGAVGEGGGDTGGFAGLVHVHHHTDSAEGFAVGVKETASDEEVFGFEREKRAIRNVIARGHRCVFGLPASPEV